MADAVRFRLAPATRKAVLVTHIAGAGAWLGMDLVLGVLTITALTGEPMTAAIAAAGISAFATWPLVATGLITLASGIVLGWGSKYGVIRYWWVLVKLVLNAVLVALVPLLLVPGVHGLADTGRDALAAGTMPVISVNNLFPPIVSSTAVTIAIVLSVFKPWGRIRERRVTTLTDVQRRNGRSLR